MENRVYLAYYADSEFKWLDAPSSEKAQEKGEAHKPGVEFRLFAEVRRKNTRFPKDKKGELK